MVRGFQLAARTVVLALSLFVSSSVCAQDYKFEITPYGGFTFGGTFTETESDTTAELDDASHLGLILNARNSANTQWEVLFSQQNTDARVTGLNPPAGSIDLAVQYLQVGGTYEGTGDTFRPFLAATVGATRFDVRDPGYDSDSFFSFSIGPGLQFQPSSRVGLRLEARAFGTLVRSGTNLFCVSNPAGGTAGCALTVAGDVLWQVQASAGIVFRF